MPIVLQTPLSTGHAANPWKALLTSGDAKVLGRVNIVLGDGVSFIEVRSFCGSQKVELVAHVASKEPKDVTAAVEAALRDLVLPGQ